MNIAQQALTGPESPPSNQYPQFSSDDAEAAYLIEAEMRGRASLFFMVVGNCAEGLAFAERDPVAFWSAAWDSTPPFMRRQLCKQFEAFVLCPNTLAASASGSSMKWRDLGQVERRFVCRVTPQLVKFTRDRLALLLEQAS